MSATFRVGVTRDFLKPDGSVGFGDIGLSMLDNAEGIHWEFLADDVKELSAEQSGAYDALLVLAPQVTAKTLTSDARLLQVARFGVGYDNVDVEACTSHGVMLTITPDGVRRPVAVAVITLMLALSHKLLIKDQLTREGRWAEKLDHLGMGVTGRTIGVVGLGNIGREVLQLADAFQMRRIASDPFVKAEDLEGTGIELVDLDALMRQSDFIAICCALTPETFHLIDADRIGCMKPTAYLINVARGSIVDQGALTAALRERRIQGAGLDVFEQEPMEADDPLSSLDNVILAPHAICWTDECFLNNGRSACQSILDCAAGRIPENIVNRAVIDAPAFQQKLKSWQNSNRS